MNTWNVEYGLRDYPPNYFDAIVDIGAGGWEIFEVAQRNPESLVYAFEPRRLAFQRLVRRQRRCGARNLVVLQEAFGNGDVLHFTSDHVYGKELGKRYVYIGYDDSYLTTLNCRPHRHLAQTKKWHGGEAIQTSTLEGLYQRHELDPRRKTFLKIDCEGSERFLMVADQTVALLRQIQHVAIELHTPAPEAEENDGFYGFPSIDEYREWLSSVFSDTHVIDLQFKKRFHNNLMHIARITWREA